MEKTYTCLIVDSQQADRRRLRQYVDRLSYLRSVGQCSRGVQALEVVHRRRVDVLFTAVELHDMTGVDLVRSMPLPPRLILTATDTAHAFEGFEIDAVDYLLQPVSFARFSRAVTKAVGSKSAQRSAGVTTAAEMLLTSAGLPYLSVRADHRLHRLPLADIRYIQSNREYVTYHLGDGRRILSLGTLSRLSQDLPAHAFIRIHRSYIVHTASITAASSQYVFVGEARLRVGGTYRQQVRERVLAR